MRRWSMYLLPFMTACMSGVNPLVLATGTTADISTGVDDVDLPGTPQTHEAFAILLNVERSSAGVGGVVELVEDSRLSQAAQGHALDMLANGYLSHTDLEGGSVGDRALAVGYDWNFIAENIAQGFNSNASVIQAWMNSPLHRDNMLDERAEDFGLGRVNGTWVLMLGREFSE